MEKFPTVFVRKKLKVWAEKYLLARNSASKFRRPQKVKGIHAAWVRSPKVCYNFKAVRICTKFYVARF